MGHKRELLMTFSLYRTLLSGLTGGSNNNLNKYSSQILTKLNCLIQFQLQTNEENEPLSQVHLKIFLAEALESIFFIMPWHQKFCH